MNQLTERLDVEPSWLLAIAVLRERIRQLPKADQDDLYELLPSLLGDDEEERESAAVAVREILDQTKHRLSRMELPEQPPEALKRWIEFVSRRIREGRDQVGMTQEALGTASGLGQTYISKLENGAHSPTAKTLDKIAAALGMPATYFDPSS